MISSSVIDAFSMANLTSSAAASLGATLMGNKAELARLRNKETRCRDEIRSMLQQWRV